MMSKFKISTIVFVVDSVVLKFMFMFSGIESKRWDDHMITYLPWYVELWIAFTLGTLILMTGLWISEVRAGRYDPTIFDLEGDDDTGRDFVFQPPDADYGNPVTKVRKTSVYDLIGED